ncbi:hypothetical protein ACFQPF_17555 [Fictibacillus iocasae]|uniref:Uncharacterized protein n=1 Tax=Fictibacillus iocasae TaxID=2715437 RepID=A0ABW2NSJ6_9BACL
MADDLVFLTLLVLVVIYHIVKNRDLLKQLTVAQLLGTCACYLSAFLLGVFCLYDAGNWISRFISHELLKAIVQFVAIGFTLIFYGYILPYLLKKVTNGVLPKS